MAIETGMAATASGGRDDYHNEDELSLDFEDNTSTKESASTDEDTNEIEEVRNEARHETFNVRLWRLVVTGALLVTAVAVTWITYQSLHDEQVLNFITAFEQFSRTIADAAVNQQEDLHRSYFAFANQISAHIELADGTWPFLTIPFFNEYAKSVLEQSRTEGLLLMHIVPHEQRAAWENWTIDNHEDMVKTAHILENGNLDDLEPRGFNPFISTFANDGSFVPIDEHDLYFPNWEYAPAPFTYGFVNWNALNDDVRRNTLFDLKNELLYSNIDAWYDASLGVSLRPEEHEAMHSSLGDSDVSHPHSYFILPVHAEVNNDESDIVAVLSGAVAWDASLNNLLPQGVEGLVTVVKSSCDQSFTYEIIGGDAVFRGLGDWHDPDYDRYVKVVDLSLPKNRELVEAKEGHCMYTMSIYPSQHFEDGYDTFTPERFAIIVMATFVAVIAVFFIYDMFVHRRNEKLVENVARSNAIVSTLFPRNIRDRLIDENRNQLTKGATGKGGNKSSQSADKRIANLKSYLKGDNNGMASSIAQKPLADLFLETTVLFADIAGFTAWSSVREPSQVFTFLETIFSSFDRVAKARRVFKVETVADCYVAATGIPEPKRDHAVVMIRFARDILVRTRQLTKDLEITHGPDTAELSLRIGVHSGPVTAGVLRGERARFQLFGDTMNTASRIEQTGEVGRIHVSSETAECLRACGKSKWVVKRDDAVEAKGKGSLQTYWIRGLGRNSSDDESVASNTSFSHDIDMTGAHLVADDQGKIDNPGKAVKQLNDSKGGKNSTADERRHRLVDWNVEMLLQLIRLVIARRIAIQRIQQARLSNMKKTGSTTFSIHGSQTDAGRSTSKYPAAGATSFVPLEEVKEIIHLPEFDRQVAKMQQSPDRIVVDPVVVKQLRSFVSNIASMYRDNAFHNFEHASHVTMSVIKLLTRIVAPTDLDDSQTLGAAQQNVAATLHDHTYGITSDPLTQLACAFSAMIHDVDHVGVPNAQLVKENTRIAQIYGNRSVAEQNSLVLSWELFMSDDYADLRACICPTASEIDRFRQLVVNGVMATDIVDKELKVLRNSRWDKAFDKSHEESVRDATNRKATIVIEHLIQASDVAHTMQHWHVYRKWNERFFRECYKAYADGRAEKNPADGWYKGELGFFDFYIIPLAKKLKDCGVFGKSSDEYLNYALANRKEWERRGESVVAEMVAAMDKQRSWSLSEGVSTVAEE